MGEDGPFKDKVILLDTSISMGAIIAIVQVSYQGHHYHNGLTVGRIKVQDVCVYECVGGVV